MGPAVEASVGRFGRIKALVAAAPPKALATGPAVPRLVRPLGPPEVGRVAVGAPPVVEVPRRVASSTAVGGGRATPSAPLAALKALPGMGPAIAGPVDAPRPRAPRRGAAPAR